jgi:flagellar assembly protein FliH
MRDAPRVINSVPAPPPIVEVKADNTALLLQAQELLDEARGQAAKLIADAEAEVKEKLAAAETESELLKQQARENGFQQGYDEGFEKGQQSALEEMKGMIAEAVGKSEQIIAMAEREAQASVLAAERQIIELSLSIARKILARELEENPMVVLPIVKKALEKVRDQEQIVIRVNPSDYELVLQAKRDLQMILGQEQSLVVSHDHTIDAGSCMVESSNGTVDARVSTQFSELEKVLREIMP